MVNNEIKAKANGFQKLSPDELNKISGGVLDDKAKAHIDSCVRTIKGDGFPKERAYFMFSYHKEICAYIDEVWDTI